MRHVLALCKVPVKLLRAREARLAKSPVRPGEPGPARGCVRTGAETSLSSGFLISRRDGENTAVQRGSSLLPVLPQNLGELVGKGAASQQGLAKVGDPRELTTAEAQQFPACGSRAGSPGCSLERPWSQRQIPGALDTHRTCKETDC